MVRARAIAIDAEERMQRIQPEQGPAGARGRERGLGKRGEVADALVVGAPQRVKMCGESEPSRACGDVVRRVAARRCDDQCRRAVAVVVEEEPVRATGKGRQRDHAPDALPAIRARDRPRRQRAGIDRVIVARAVLAHDVQPLLRAGRGGVLRQRDRPRVTFDGHDRGGQRAASAAFRDLDEPRARLLGRRRAEPHRVEQRALGVGADLVTRTADVPPFGGDAGSGGEAREHRGLDAGTPRLPRDRRLLGDDDHRARGDRRRLRSPPCARRADRRPAVPCRRGSAMRSPRADRGDAARMVRRPS